MHEVPEIMLLSLALEGTMLLILALEGTALQSVVVMVWDPTSWLQ